MHTAKATGFSSVSELLRVKGLEDYGPTKISTSLNVCAMLFLFCEGHTVFCFFVLWIGSTTVHVTKPFCLPPVALPKQWGKENSVTENSNSNLQCLSLPSNLDEQRQKRMKQEGLEEIQDNKRRKSKTNAMKFHNEDFYASIPLPQGTELTSVSGIEIPPEDAGHALQFLEFCAAFREASEL